MGCASSSPEGADAEKKQAQSVADPRPVANHAIERIPSVKATSASGAPIVNQPLSAVKAKQRDVRSSSGIGAAAESSVTAAQQAKGKGRRAAAGTEAMRNQIMKQAVGGPQNPNDASLYEVSDSENEEDDLTSGPGWSKPQEVTDAITEALKNNFIFKGIAEPRLVEIVDRMKGVQFKAGSVVVQQGDLPKENDCMYFLESGEAEVVISGAVDASSKNQGGEDRQVVGNTVRILQKKGWVFGDVALLFNSSRTASVVAKTDLQVWALYRKTFLQFVMKHAQGARALRFLRKLPLLKGLSDNDLIRTAARMPQRVYQDGQPLIKYGERGDELFLIRYGKVKVMRPDGNGGRILGVVLGRGQFVGERAVVNNKMRSADCIAQGQVQVVVMKKKDFMELDNPLLAWMLDYDAVSTCLRFVPQVKHVKQEQMEQILDRFEARKEQKEGDILVRQGDLIDRLYVVKYGEVRLSKEGQEQVQDPSFLHEAGAAFTFFAEAALDQPFKSPYTVTVASELSHILQLQKRQLDHFLGKDLGLNTVEAVIGALKKARGLANVTEPEFKVLLKSADEKAYGVGDVVINAALGPTNRVFLVKSGAITMVSPDTQQRDSHSGQINLNNSIEMGRLIPGSLFNEEALMTQLPPVLKSSLVSSEEGTIVISFTSEQVESATNSRSRRNSGKTALNRVKFQELELHRIVGTGQFGLVRLVRHNVPGSAPGTGDVFALKVMHKAPITEAKQIEHVLNERKILEEATHPFCVQLRGAYQDPKALYLLQEWVPGGELFHHLDLEGAFDEATAMFFAANVLLALESLHVKGIVYRDLKPENLLLDAQGYLKMADFGFAKYLGTEKTFTICGTPDYQAPEVIMRKGTNKAADYWGLGVLIFEMLVGDPPFKSLTGDPWDTFRRTLSGRFYVPNFISDASADIIFKLLQVNPDKRLGSGRSGADEIKQHRFFSRIDWAALEEKKIPAPIKPKIRNPLDTSNFDNYDSSDVAAPTVPPEVAAKQPDWDMWDWI